MFRLMNNVKTVLLLTMLMAIFFLVGSFFGRSGMILALIIGGFMNIIAFFFSDKIALATMGVKSVTQEQAPELHQIVRILAERANLPMPRIYLCPQQNPTCLQHRPQPQQRRRCCHSGTAQIPKS